jgi:hypothetical protein
VLTLRAAAGLLEARGPDALAAIAVACGFEGPALPLAPRDHDTLGLGSGGATGSYAVRVARGPGTLRALLVQSDLSVSSDALHDVLPRLATRLVRRAPHLAWLCIAAGNPHRESAPPDGDRSARQARDPEDEGPTRRGTPREIIQTARRRGRPAVRELVLASWSGERCPPRIAVLVVDSDAVMDSDADTLAALAAAAGPDDGLTHSRWLDLLGRESLGRRFYHALDRAVMGLATGMSVPTGVRRPTADARYTVALLYASRLLFLSFLEAKGWLDTDRGFLVRTFGECVAAAGGYHARVLRPLFFGTLNTPRTRRAPSALRFGRIPFLNGGLFGPTPLEAHLRHATFSDASLGVLVADVLSHYRFTAQEDRRSWSEAAIDPEMLGKAFETLMAPDVRRATGAYYTPQSVVEQVTHDALAHVLSSADAPADSIAALLHGEAVGSLVAAAVRRRLASVRVMDPACGSGAFLVHALEVLGRLAGAVGDPRPVHARRRAVLTQSIFGVDVSPIAVWLCELRLWLAVVIETHATDPESIIPLPNLDRNIRVGDALAGGGFGPPVIDVRAQAAEGRAGQRVARLRGRYAHASGARKRDTARALEKAERGRAIVAVQRLLAQVTGERLDAVTMARGRDLFGAATATRGSDRAHRAELRRRARLLRQRLRALHDGGVVAFTFAAHFSDVDVAGGFDLVVGNPPWVRPHAVPVIDRERLRRDFVVSRAPAWAPGGAARAGPAFGPQVDLAALFVEQALSITRAGGVVALLVPAKLWRCLAGSGVRQLVTERSTLLAIEDWSGARVAFDAAVYPSLLVVRRSDSLIDDPTPGDAPSADHRARD